MIGYIYIRTSNTGRKYVGQTRNKNRAERDNRQFDDLWIDIEIIEYSNITDEQLNNEEIQKIKEHNSMKPHGYNIEAGGGVVRKKEIDDTEIKTRELLKQGGTIRGTAEAVDRSNGYVFGVKDRMKQEENIDTSHTHTPSFLPTQLTLPGF